jgi:hypothetical protein
LCQVIEGFWVLEYDVGMVWSLVTGHGRRRTTRARRETIEQRDAREHGEVRGLMALCRSILAARSNRKRTKQPGVELGGSRYGGDRVFNRWWWILVFALTCLASPSSAQVLSGKGAELPLQTVVTPHFRVLHPPRLERFARRVAASAEYIRAGVIGTVGNDPGLTYIVVNDETDEFNGFATPGPYPFIRVYAAFPRPTDIGAQFEDALVSLVGHEYAHVAHLTTRDALRDLARGIFGSIPSILDARVPPGWFVEGYAVHLESKLTTGGRVSDSTTRSIRRGVARAGRFPSLSDAGIGTFDDYPFGNTKYVFGAGFVNFLVQRYGEEGLRRVIARYNATIAFSDAWRDVHGTTLEALWEEWKLEETRAALQERDTLASSRLSTGSFLHAGSGVPAWQNQNRYAFLQGNSVRHARLEGTREVLEPGFTTLPSRPHRLSFTKDGALVYSRLVARGATTIGELFRFENGRETQLTQGARARDAIADGNCILYVQGYLEQSRLRRFCDARDEIVYEAPEGWQLFHPMVNARGEIALTVWRPGGFVDVAVLRTPSLEFLTSDFAQDQFPTWLPDGRLVFSSDRSGIAQLYVARAGEFSARPLTANVGGAFGNSVSPSGVVSFSGFTGVGLETRFVTNPVAGEPVALEVHQPRALEGLDGAEFRVEPYQPNLAPLFWTPFTTNGVGATVYGADAAGIHTYQVALGWDVLTGTGVNARAEYSFAPALDWSLNASVGFTSRFGVSASLGVPFQGRGESQVTGRFSYIVNPFVNLEGGAVRAGLFVRFGALGQDVFGYLERGWRWTMTLDSTGSVVTALTLADVVSGQPFAVAVRVNLEPLEEPSFTMQGQTHNSLGVHWRYPDGFVGLERLTFVPFANLEWRGGVTRFGAGAQVMLDFTVNYYVPLSLGLEVSWQGGNGWSVRLVTLVPLLEGLR